MTLTAAYILLDSRRLVFGDSEQINAVNFIAAVQSAYDRSKACTHHEECECQNCDGEGTVDCECDGCGHIHDAKCDECKGTGRDSICKICHPDLNTNIEIALRETLQNGWPKIPAPRDRAA